MDSIEYSICENSSKMFKQRDCVSRLVEFIKGNDCYAGKVMAVYGLRRTGKSTAAQQAVVACGFKPNEYAGWTLSEEDSFSDVKQALNNAHKSGVKVVILDEVTNCPDFIDKCSSLADVYAKLGIRIMIAGTDSLGLMLAADNQLYDRMRMVSTTHIPFAEHSRLLETKDIDEYIERGGLLGNHGKENTVHDYKSAMYYQNAFVADNISKSLSKTVHLNENEYKIRDLSREQIRAAIEKITEYYSGKISKEMLQRSLDSSTISYPFEKAIDGLSEYERLKINYQNDSIVEAFAKEINTEQITGATVTADMVQELIDALENLGFLSEITEKRFEKETGKEWEERFPSNKGNKTEKFVSYHIVQPAIKYNHFEKAVEFIKRSPFYNSLKEAAKSTPEGAKNPEAVVLERLDEKIKGDMLEQIIPFDVKNCAPEKYDVFKPKFVIKRNKSEIERQGEYDMLVYDRGQNIHWIFEIKHNSKIYDVSEAEKDGLVGGQDDHLLDKEFAAAAEKKFGKCCKRIVLYSGELAKTVNETLYINSADFLCEFHKTKDMSKTIVFFEAMLNRGKEPPSPPGGSGSGNSGIDPDNLFDGYMEELSKTSAGGVTKESDMLAFQRLTEGDDSATKREKKRILGERIKAKESETGLSTKKLLSSEVEKRLERCANQSQDARKKPKKKTVSRDDGGRGR